MQFQVILGQKIHEKGKERGSWALTKLQAIQKKAY